MTTVTKKSHSYQSERRRWSGSRLFHDTLYFSDNMHNKYLLNINKIFVGLVIMSNENTEQLYTREQVKQIIEEMLSSVLTS